MSVPFDIATTVRFQNNAEDEFAHQANCIVDRVALNLAPGVAIYNLPSSCINIKRVTYKGWKVFPLPHRDLRSSFQSGTQQSRPYWYIFNNIGQNQIRFFPVPNEVTSSIQQSEVLDSSPNLFLPLTETSGIIAEDLASNNLDGTYINSPILGVEGPFQDGSKVITLNGTNQYITIPNNDSLNVGGIGFSISFWFKPLSLAGTPTIIDKGITSYKLYLNGGKIYYNVGGTDLMRSLATLVVNTWYHVVFNYDPFSFPTIYLNGIDSTDFLGGFTIPVGNANPLEIGRTNGGGNYLNASIGSVTFTQFTVLSPTQIIQQYNAGIYGISTNHNPWGSAIRDTCLIEFFRLPDQNTSIIPSFIRNRLLTYYSNKRNYAMEGRTQDLKASQYWGNKYENFKQVYMELLEDLNNKPRMLVANTKTQRPYGYLPPPPILPIDRFGYSVDE